MKTYDCYLDLCVNLKRSLFGVLKFKHMYYNVSGKKKGSSFVIGIMVHI